VDVLAVSNRPSPAEGGPLESPFSHPHSRGMSPGTVNDVVICPWNNPKILRSILDDHDGEFAAAIAEPIVANNACIIARRRLPGNFAGRMPPPRNCFDLR